MSENKENSIKVKPSAFLLIKTKKNAKEVIKTIKTISKVIWAEVVFGPYQIVAYLKADNLEEITNIAEEVRTNPSVLDIDARVVKIIPGDENLQKFEITKKENAVLLVNVNYKEEKERIVTYNLRKLDGVKVARAMWGPADIIVIVEADNHESMRNLICDDIKTMKGVKTNTTLYCYPRGNQNGRR